VDTHDLLGPRDSEAGVILDGALEDCSTIVEQHGLDDHVALLIAANPGIGAVLVDRTGHVRLVEPEGDAGDGMTLAPGVYASIQCAIDAAEDGDAIYVVAGTYREQLTIRGKQLDLLGATADDGALLVTLEAPDVADLDVDPVEDAGELTAQCAVIRVRNHADVTMRHLIVDGRNQGSVLKSSDSHLEFASISTTDSDTVIEDVQTRGFDQKDAVRLVDGCGHVKANFTTIQAAINAAAGGDEIIICPSVYREDLYIRQRITMRCAGPAVESERPDSEAVIVGEVVIAATALAVVVDGVVIEGRLETESTAGATASVTLRNSRIDAPRSRTVQALPTNASVSFEGVSRRC
jgi:hypothetical protein